VIVHDLNVVRIAGVPAEANLPLVVDPDAVLPLSITPQPFESITRRHPQIVDRPGSFIGCSGSYGRPTRGCTVIESRNPC
jgi:hypothetical protein